MEHLIHMGYHELIFRAGVGPPLSRNTLPVPTIRASLDERYTPWRAVRYTFGALRHVLPRRAAEMADWVSVGSHARVEQ